MGPEPRCGLAECFWFRVPYRLLSGCWPGLWSYLKAALGADPLPKSLTWLLARDFSSLLHRCFHRETHNMVAGCPLRECRRERGSRERGRKRERDRDLANPSVSLLSQYSIHCKGVTVSHLLSRSQWKRQLRACVPGGRDQQRLSQRKLSRGTGRAGKVPVGTGPYRSFRHSGTPDSQQGQEWPSRRSQAFLWPCRVWTEIPFSRIPSHQSTDRGGVLRQFRGAHTTSSKDSRTDFLWETAFTMASERKRGRCIRVTQSEASQRKTNIVH